MAKLPKQVQEQVKKAEERRKSMYEKGDEQPTADANPGEGEHEAPASEDVQVEPQADQQPQPQSEGRDYKAQYDALRGKYDAEVPRLSHQLQDAIGRLRQMESMVSEQAAENKRLKEAVDAAQKQREDAKKVDTDFDPQSFADYDESFVKLAQRVKQFSSAEDLLSEQQRRIDEIEKRSLSDAQNRFYADLEMAVPEWEKLNKDQGFINWLSQSVPYAGYSKQAVLDNAHKNLDARTAASLFRGYLSEVEGAGGGSPERKTQRPKPSIQPRGSAPVDNPNAPKGQDKKVWTRGEIDEVHRRYAAGKFRGNDAEFQRLNTEIYKAIQEGRVK